MQVNPYFFITIVLHTWIVLVMQSVQSSTHNITKFLFTYILINISKNIKIYIISDPILPKSCQKPPKPAKFFQKIPKTSQNILKTCQNLIKYPQLPKYFLLALFQQHANISPGSNPSRQPRRRISHQTKDRHMRWSVRFQ
jgi:hypothetical protein